MGKASDALTQQMTSKRAGRQHAETENANWQISGHLTL